MTTQEVISNLSAWLKEAVCDKLELKRATEYEQASAEGYKYTLVKPAVYEVTLPANAAEYDKEGDTDAPIVAPCVTVTCSGTGTLNTRAGWVETPITLNVQTWNPGMHVTDADGNTGFAVTSEGWRDLAVFIDRITKELADAELPGGLVLSAEIRPTFPNVEDNQYYPYYRGRVEFSVTHNRRIKPKFNI